MLHEDKELCFRMRLPRMPSEKWLCFSGGHYSANTAAPLLILRNFCPLNTTKHCIFETISEI